MKTPNTLQKYEFEFLFEKSPENKIPHVKLYFYEKS